MDNIRILKNRINDKQINTKGNCVLLLNYVILYDMLCQLIWR